MADQRRIVRIGEGLQALRGSYFFCIVVGVSLGGIQGFFSHARCR